VSEQTDGLNNGRVSAFWDEVNDTLRVCRRHCYATRAREIQVEHRDGLHALAERCLALKEEAVAASDEHLANALLKVCLLHSDQEPGT
jgi:hypothetical protein